MASSIQEYANIRSCRGRGIGDTDWSAPVQVMLCEMIREYTPWFERHPFCVRDYT